MSDFDSIPQEGFIGFVLKKDDDLGAYDKGPETHTGAENSLEGNSAKKDHTIHHFVFFLKT